MPQEIIEGFRLSPQQEHVWHLQRDDERGPYRAQCEVRIAGRPDARRLEAAWRDVLAQHEILRTTFHSPEGLTAPLQVVGDAYSPEPLTVEDLGGLGESEQQRLIAQLLEDESARPFDPAASETVRLRLLRLSDEAHTLLVTLPALCADAATLDNLARELAESYASPSRAADEEAMQYAVFAEWQNELLASEDAEAGRQFWRDLDLASFPTLKLPFEHELDEAETFEPRLFEARAGRVLSEKIEAACARSSATTDAFLLACWQVLLGRLSGESELLILSACSGRSDEELERALGLFARNLPTPCRLAAQATFASVLEEAGRALRAAEEWQECFSWETATAFDPAGSEHLPAYFSFEFERPAGSYNAGDVTFTVARRRACTDRFKLKLTAAPDAEGLLLSFQYDAKAFEATHVARLAARFQRLLESAADSPISAVESLELLGEEERRMLLFDFNSTAEEFGGESLVHGLFEAQAARTPAAVAVEFEAETVTYAELEGRANRLAQHLRALGVGADAKVAVCLDSTLR